jgi:hypothetical protein
VGDVQEAELKIPSVRWSLSASSSTQRDLGVKGMPDPVLLSAIVLMIGTRAVVVAAAIVNVIRRQAANQFRKSGTLLVSQPSIAQKR